jgi:hypothetical protein
MSTKTLLGALIGGVCFWLLGFLMYGVLLRDLMAEYSAIGRASGEEMMIHLILGNLLFGLLLAWLWSRMGITNFSRGASSGAFVGLLSSLAANLIMYGTTTAWNAPTGIIYDVLALTVMWGVTGGVVGWWMGRK